MEWQPKAIVVGVDGSETSRTVAEHAVGMILAVLKRSFVAG